MSLTTAQVSLTFALAAGCRFQVHPLVQVTCSSYCPEHPLCVQQLLLRWGVLSCLLQLQTGGSPRQHDYGTLLHIYCSLCCLNLPLKALARGPAVNTEAAAAVLHCACLLYKSLLEQPYFRRLLSSIQKEKMRVWLTFAGGKHKQQLVRRCTRHK